jgi:hypothetical protein
MMPTPSFTRFCAALLLMLLGLLQACVATAPTQPTSNPPVYGAPVYGTPADSGEYQILQALYGTATYNVDVTPRLRDLARQDRLFRLGNDTIGVDPHPGNVKTLRIYARGRDGQTRLFEYREGNQIDGALFVGWGGGNWGQGGWNGGWAGNAPVPVQPVPPVPPVPVYPGNPNVPPRVDSGEYQILQARYGTAERNVDVTPRLKELARQDAKFRLTNSTLGVDPHPGQTKTLRIFARGRDGQQRSFDYTEGSIVDGALFTGWGRGNWGQDGWNGGWTGANPPRGPNPAPSYPGTTPGYPIPQSTVLNIISASYGSGTRQVDITQRLRSRVQDGRLDVHITNDLAGYDPAPRVTKDLVVIYRVGGGPEQRAQLREYDQLRLP